MHEEPRQEVGRSCRLRLALHQARAARERNKLVHSPPVQQHWQPGKIERCASVDRVVSVENEKERVLHCGARQVSKNHVDIYQTAAQSEVDEAALRASAGVWLSRHGCVARVIVHSKMDEKALKRFNFENNVSFV